MEDRTSTNGYITVPTPKGDKTAHFRMNFIKNLHDMGTSLTELGKDMQSEWHIGSTFAFAQLLYAGFKAFDDQNGIEVDYNVEQCLEWTLLLDEDIIKEFQEVLIFATYLNQKLDDLGKKKPQKRQTKKKTSNNSSTTA